MTPISREAPSGERAARKRAAIVRAARQEFLRKGFNAGMDVIAAKAGVSKVTVYNHFSNKEELFAEIVHEALEQAFDDTMVKMRARLGAADDIREILVSTAEGWVEGIAQPDVLALRALIAGEGRRFPELGQAWQEKGPARFTAVLSAALSEHDGLDIPDMRLAVIQFYALVLYPHIIHSAYGETFDAETTQALIDKGVDMFLRYYRAPA
jgi:TetR/AcrR family transcriptional regulator, mexJK operon transcriptional repressor